MTLDFRIETNNLIDEKKFDWAIQRFSKLPNLVKSPPFFLIAGCSIKYNVILEFVTERNDYYYFYVKISTADEKNSAAPIVGVKGTISMKNTADELWKSALNFNVTMIKNQAATCSKILSSFKLPRNISETFPLRDDILIIEFKITCETHTSTIAPVSSLMSFKDQKSSAETLKLIYQRNALCDFTFHCGKETIHAHKLILSTRSPVFEKMFEHDTEENRTNSVTIKDTDFLIFKNFIRYIYTWEIEEDLKIDFEMLLALYQVADKYQLLDLRTNCSQLLFSNCLNVNTVCKILQVADMHQDHSFKSVLMEFFLRNFSEVTKISEWPTFIVNNVTLAAEIVASQTSIINLIN